MQTKNISETTHFVESFEELLKEYYWDEVGLLLQRWPQDQTSLEINFSDLYRFDPDLATDVRENPELLLKYAEEALVNLDIPVDIDLTGARVRLSNLPSPHTFNVGEYRTHQRGEYISVTGQVSRRTQVKSKAVLAAWECARCGTLSKLPQLSNEDFQEPHECEGCERQGPFRLDFGESEFIDYQQVRVQKPPELASGGTSEHIDINLEGDITDRIQPGDRVDINGVLQMRPTDGDNPLFDYILEGYSIEHKDTSYMDIEIQPHLDEIKEYTSNRPFETLINALAPKVFGYDHIKESIVLQLFGGVRGQYETGSADRGSIHILLLGDPGTAKSKLLRATDEISPRSTFASGKGTSAAGLTAGVNSDDFGQQRFSLEAGALVKANEGLACIDEIDKVDEETRSSLHTALEQQVVEVNKIIQATLPARTALLAAGNPKYGRFDPYEPIGDQITLGAALMSRFDLMFMIQDQVDEKEDRRIANHIIDSNDAAIRATHTNDSGPDADLISPDVDIDVIRAWIAYARQNVFPVFEDETVKRRLRENFVEFRSLGDPTDSPIPLTFRKLEAALRLARASARVRLSDTIEMEDVERAQRLIGKSMRDVGKDPDTGEFDADVLETGTTKSQRERVKTVKEVIKALEAEYGDGVPYDVIIERLVNAGIDKSKAEHEFEKLRKQGDVYDRGNEKYRLV